MPGRSLPALMFQYHGAHHHRLPARQNAVAAHAHFDDAAAFARFVKALASVAWPQRRTSTVGVSQRSDQPPAMGCRNAVSESFISRATSFIHGSSAGASRMQTAAGLPVNGRLVKASMRCSVWLTNPADERFKFAYNNRRRMVLTRAKREMDTSRSSSLRSSWAIFFKMGPYFTASWVKLAFQPSTSSSTFSS